MKTSNIARMGAGILTSRVLGLFRDQTLAIFFGVSAKLDAYIVAFSIPNIFRSFIVEGAFSSSYIPLMHNKLSESHKKLNYYTTGLLLIQGMIILSIVITIFTFSYIIATLYLKEYNDPEIIKLCSNLLKICIFYLILIGVAGTFISYLNIFDSYYIPYMSTAILNIGIITGCIIGYYLGENIYILAIGALCGGTAQFLIVLMTAFKHGFRFSKTKKLFDNDIKKTFTKMPTLFFITSLNQLNIAIGMIVATFVTLGGISYLYFASRVYQLPLAIIGLSISTVGINTISKKISTKQSYHNSIDIFIVLSLCLNIPATIGLFLLSEDIVSFLFGYNKFDTESILQTSSLLKGFSLGLIFGSFTGLFQKVFYAKQTLKVPFFISIITFLINIILMLVLINSLGLMGISLSISISSIISSFALYFFMKDYNFNIRKHFHTLLRIALANIVLFFILYYFQFLDFSLLIYKINLAVLIKISIGALTYFMLLYILKVNIFKLLKKVDG